MPQLGFCFACACMLTPEGLQGQQWQVIAQPWVACMT